VNEALKEYARTVGAELRRIARNVHPMAFVMVPAVSYYLDNPDDVEVAYDGACVTVNDKRKGLRSQSQSLIPSTAIAAAALVVPASASAKTTLLSVTSPASPGSD
jgi:hypothetical protein